MAPGNHTATATVSDDPIYEDKTSEPEEFTVPKISDYPVDVVVTPDDDGITVNVTVPDDFDGNVTVDVNGTKYPVTIDENGTGTIDIPLGPGNYTVVVELDNSTNYDNKTTDPIDVTIDEKIADIEITTTGSSDKVPYGEIIEYVITVHNKGLDDATDVVVENIIPDGFTYIWDSINNIAVPYGPVFYNASDNLLSASVQSYDKSTGTWYIGDLANGESTTLTIKLRADYVGVKYINASVSGKEGDSDLENNNASVSVTVDAVSNYTIDVDVEPGNPGENTTITVTVPEDVTGDVTVIVDGEEYPVTPVNGTAILDVPLDEGNHTVSVKVSDDPKYADKESDPETFEVAKDDSYSIDVDVEPGRPGENTTITVTVPEDVTGTVTVIVDGEEYPVTPVNGTAILDVPLGEGNHTVSVKVSDDPKYADKTSDEEEFEVAKDDSYTIDIDVEPGKAGENTTITVTVPEDLTGDVIVVIDGKEYPVTPVNGTVVLDVPLGEGNHTVSVKVSDDPIYADKTSDE